MLQLLLLPLFQVPRAEEFERRGEQSLRPRNPVSQCTLRVREEGEQKAVGNTGKKAGDPVSDSGGEERTREQTKVGCRHLDKAEEIMLSPKKLGIKRSIPDSCILPISVAEANN